MKKKVVRVLTVASVGLFVLHLYALSVVTGSPAGGAGWWTTLFVVLGPLAALAALGLSLRAPRQEVMAILSGLLILFYLGVWVQVVPLLGGGGAG